MRVYSWLVYTYTFICMLAGIYTPPCNISDSDVLDFLALI